jgi:sporulation protein YlmC with PRC-barrel domain
MSEPSTYTIGSEVSCSDGSAGKLTRVVLDPVARALTHLVVEPKHLEGLGRLVPVELVDVTSGVISLKCTTAEFNSLEQAEETHFLTGGDGQLGYGGGQMLAWPYYGLGTGLGDMGMGSIPPVITEDRVPVGDVEVRRGEHVHASDGAIGRLQGLVIDPGDHHVTHLLLDEGHLWGKRRVSIPIGAVSEVTDEGVRLTLTRDQVRDLPPVELSNGSH